ncbi:Hypothetical predicted protein [Mytilus galloprovincialis]|uniref:Uncharacterized protein n=1 Tax=Mytilus galloprovincialis TaxID=29158 RepID=A0A8B6DF43_MYTGA|nr:Hypothetical predicted protein [Mytilus galloprovincialis]
MEHLLTPILVGLLISATLAIKVTLQGPKYTRRNDVITFNCSTDTPSVGLEAEILINSKTYTNMRTHNNICFSAVQGVGCAEDVCQCSKRGYWFLHKYHVKLDNVENDLLKVTCVMKFGAEGVDKMFDSITIEIIGPPIILSTKIVTENIVTIAVNFYSTSDIQRPVWFSEPIYDTTVVNATIDNITLSLVVHNRALTCNGYVAKMSVGIFKNMKYTVLLKNEFGDARKTFKLHSDLKESFDFRFLIFGLSIFGVFLVATTMTIAILRGKQNQTPGSLDDDHVYERTNPQYLELLEVLPERHYSDIKEDENELQPSRNEDVDDYEEVD